MLTVMPISPVGDLRPLIETSMNEAFGLDEERAVAESPTLGLPMLEAKVHVWVGGAERPAFVDQARRLHEAWAGSSLTIDAARHHFDVIDTLKDPESEMIGRLLT